MKIVEIKRKERGAVTPALPGPPAQGGKKWQFWGNLGGNTFFFVIFFLFSFFFVSLFSFFLFFSFFSFFLCFFFFLPPFSFCRHPGPRTEKIAPKMEKKTKTTKAAQFWARFPSLQEPFISPKPCPVQTQIKRGPRPPPSAGSFEGFFGEKKEKFCYMRGRRGRRGAPPLQK